MVCTSGTLSQVIQKYEILKKVPKTPRDEYEKHEAVTVQFLMTHELTASKL